MPPPFEPINAVWEQVPVSQGKSTVWIVVFVVVVAVAAALVTLVGRARVSGETPKERIAAICRLADEAPRGAADAIARAAAEDPDPTVRLAALRALGNFPEPKYRSMVVSATSHADPAVRAAAAGTLAMYSDDPAAGRLNELAGEDPDSQVRLDAVAALGACTSARSLVYLVQQMEGNDDPEVQMRARDAVLRRLKMPARTTRPDNVRLWRNDVELVKLEPKVKAAFEETSAAVVHHPEHIIPEPGQ